MRSKTTKHDLTLQEEEERLKSTTKKRIVFLVLKSAGPAGLDISKVVDAAQQHSDWGVTATDKNMITKVLEQKGLFRACLNFAGPFSQHIS